MGQILKKLVEVVKGQILAGWAQKSPEPCCGLISTRILHCPCMMLAGADAFVFFSTC
jgi:hypothetical protein